MNEQKKQNQKATLVITYNSVRNYPTGTYKTNHGPLVVYSHENTKTWGDRQAEGKLSQIMHGIFGRINPADVDKIYLYAGLYAKNGALQATKKFAGEGNKVTLVACDCDSDEKEAFARYIGAKLIWSECGGVETLGRIVSQELAK